MSRSKKNTTRTPAAANGKDDVSASLGEWTVEKIVRRAVANDGEVIYQVKWVGWPETDNTWEPLCKLSNYLEMVARFDAQIDAAAASSVPVDELESSPTVRGTVAELRAKCKNAGLDTKGTKAELVARLNISTATVTQPEPESGKGRKRKSTASSSTTVTEAAEPEEVKEVEEEAEQPKKRGKKADAASTKKSTTASKKGQKATATAGEANEDDEEMEDSEARVPTKKSATSASTAQSSDQLARRQANLIEAVAQLEENDEIKLDRKLASLLRSAKLISCTTPPGPSDPSKYHVACWKGVLEAVVDFSTARTRLEFKWDSGDAVDQESTGPIENMLFITNLTTECVIFRSMATQQSIYRDTPEHFIHLQRGVNKLSTWLAAQGVKDCKQWDEPSWSSSGRGCCSEPDEHPQGNNLHHFLTTICACLFDQGFNDDMRTGDDGSLLFSIIYNQRPRHDYSG